MKDYKWFVDSLNKAIDLLESVNNLNGSRDYDLEEDIREFLNDSEDDGDN